MVPAKNYITDNPWMLAPPKSIDISIVTYNSAKWLDNFLQSLMAQNLSLTDICLHFRDNGSTDETVAKLTLFKQEQTVNFCSIDIQTGSNVGFGAGHNSNFQQCASDYVLVTNVDLEFEPDTLITLLAQASQDSADVASWECRQKPFEHPKDYHPVTGDTLWSSSACILFRRSALQAVNGYEPLLFMYGEDVELSYRLRDNGYRLRYMPQATVWHHTYEEAAQVKPLQFLGSTLANVLLRCRYGSRAEVMQGFLMFLGLFALRPQFPGQRRQLLAQSFKLIQLAPRFLVSRRKSTAPFPFRMWDYAMVRDGAFHAYPEEGPALTPLVSVLIRTMPGCGARLKEAITSVACQTYGPIHLVVVEDGGNTAQEQITSIEQSGRFTHVSYRPLEKSGRCKAGNAALQEAKGDLVCFLDDDDLFYADHLEVLVTAWAKQPELGAVYGLAYEVKTQIIDKDAWVYKDLMHSLIHRQPFSRPLLWHHNFMPIQTVLFKRQLFLDHGGFDPELDNLEDWNLWVRYSLKHDFLMIPKVTSLYRVPAETDKAIQRQGILDDYYAIAQKKHAQLKVELSPPEILKLAEQLSRELYIGVIPTAVVRNTILKMPFLNWLYHPAKRAWSLWRAVRAR
jgi:GT2 family glycosyltransferase